MPGARKQYKESGSGKFGIKITYRFGQEAEIKWFAIEERRDQVLKKAKQNPNILLASKMNR